MNARKARLKRWRGSDCAGSPTWHQEALPFSLSASRQRAVQTTSAYLHWCGADPPNSLSTPAPSLAMQAHGPPKRGHFSAILAGFYSCMYLFHFSHIFTHMPSFWTLCEHRYIGGNPPPSLRGFVRLCNLAELHVFGGIHYPSLLQEAPTNLRNWKYHRSTAHVHTW